MIVTILQKNLSNLVVNPLAAPRPFFCFFKANVVNGGRFTCSIYARRRRMDDDGVVRRRKKGNLIIINNNKKRRIGIIGIITVFIRKPNNNN